jgi:hypothetical protein
MRWAEAQAEGLRRAAEAGSNLPLDWYNLAEEIESLGRSQRRELRSRLATIIEHLLKLQFSPAMEPRDDGSKPLAARGGRSTCCWRIARVSGASSRTRSRPPPSGRSLSSLIFWSVAARVAPRRARNSKTPATRSSRCWVTGCPSGALAGNVFRFALDASPFCSAFPGWRFGLPKGAFCS